MDLGKNLHPVPFIIPLFIRHGRVSFIYSYSKHRDLQAGEMSLKWLTSKLKQLFLTPPDPGDLQLLQTRRFTITYSVTHKKRLLFESLL